MRCCSTSLADQKQREHADTAYAEQRLPGDLEVISVLHLRADVISPSQMSTNETPHIAVGDGRQYFTGIIALPPGFESTGITWRHSGPITNTVTGLPSTAISTV